MKNNPWHCISYGLNIPEIVNAIIEIPKGSKTKYELEKESGLLKMDRVLFSSVHYPANYGFIPQTLSEDNDPLDILVLSSVTVVPMCIVEAKIIGLMTMIDEDEKDDKIIAVANSDMSVNYINDVLDLPPHTTIELKRFFEDYKKLEHKRVFVEQFLGKKEAYKVISQSVENYKLNILKTINQ
ncbi:MAG TPA: inorganic diphosphatase [Melioribacteraceae bacterium]|nr:inorganic diphosphatase [Melioribacteraceae bacterium]